MGHRMDYRRSREDNRRSRGSAHCEIEAKSGLVPTLEMQLYWNTSMSNHIACGYPLVMMAEIKRYDRDHGAYKD
jgi:hypothetical protein